MKLFRDEVEKSSFSRFRAKQLLLELAKNELDSERKAQVEHWISHCKETQVEWQALNKALNWCENKSQLQAPIVDVDQVISRTRKKSLKKFLLIGSMVAIISAVGLLSLKHFDFINSRFQLLAQQPHKILPRVEALNLEVVTGDNHKVEQILSQFKKEGTEVKSIPGNQNNEGTWVVFVMQSHVRQLIEQIKTLGLVRIPEGYSAELVSDGQIQIILKSKSL